MNHNPIETSLHLYIDSFQNQKKQAVALFCPHPTVRSTLNSFINAQSVYTKSFVDSCLDTASRLGFIVASPHFFNDFLESMKINTHHTKEDQ